MQPADIKKIMADQSKRGDELLRALANYSDWFLVVDKQNCAIFWEFDGKKTLGVMTERKSPDKEKREFLEMRGRHLMNNLPEETDMICFDLSTDHAVCLNDEGISRLKNIALALSCEEALSAPPVLSTEKDLINKSDKILNHEWIILWNKDQPLVMPYKGLEGVLLFTAFDTIDAFLAKQKDPEEFYLAHLPGSEIFKLLDERTDYDGVFINAGSDLELFPFAPAQIHDIAKGKQPRPERKILKARCIGELNHFLDESSMVAERPHTTERINDEEVVHYTGEILPGMESRTFRFYPVKQSASATEWGDGPSEIVCPGKLADLIRRRLEILEDEQKPLNEDLKKFAQSSIVWVNELKKLFDPNIGKLPRQVLRTVDGARFVREYPEIATRAFVDKALATLTS